MIRLVLPFPPSVNHYWRHKGRGVFLSREARQFRADCKAAIGRGVTPLCDPCTVTIEYYPPNRRLRDLDNLLKATLDAITHCGVWMDDRQVQELHLHWGGVVKGGMTVVVIARIEALCRSR